MVSSSCCCCAFTLPAGEDREGSAAGREAAGPPLALPNLLPREGHLEQLPLENSRAPLKTACLASPPDLERRAPQPPPPPQRLLRGRCSFTLLTVCPVLRAGLCVHPGDSVPQRRALSWVCHCLCLGSAVQAPLQDSA